MRLHVTISKARDGLHDYIQILSDDAQTVNVVLVTDAVLLQDAREPAQRVEPEKRRKGR